MMQEASHDQLVKKVLTLLVLHLFVAEHMPTELAICLLCPGKPSPYFTSLSAMTLHCSAQMRILLGDAKSNDVAPPRFALL